MQLVGPVVAPAQADEGEHRPRGGDVHEEGAVAPPVVGVDILRIADGRIAEHWDVLQPEVPAEDTVSGRPVITTT